MFLYEKNKSNIDVYELKEDRDKIIKFKKQEMEKIPKDERVYKILSNNKDELRSFTDLKFYNNSLFINKSNMFFKHKNGLKLQNINYLWENEILIDGLVYQICEKECNLLLRNIVKLYKSNNEKIDGKEILKYLVCMTSDIKTRNKNEAYYNGEFFQYELPNLISIPKSIYLLNLLESYSLSSLIDETIDDQLALYDSNSNPIKRLDYDTVRFMYNYGSNYYLSDDGLEISENILKKVKQLHK